MAFLDVISVLSSLRRIERLLRELLRAQNIELEMEYEQMLDLSNITREVEETKGGVASAKKAFELLGKKIDELKGQISNPADQAKVDELSAGLQAAQDDLAAAIAANPDANEVGTGATGSTGASIGGASPSE